MSNNYFDNYKFKTILPYIVYFESTEDGIFITFENESTLLSVLKNELLKFGGADENSIESLQIELDEIFPSSLEEFDDKKISQINNLIPFYNIGYVGTLEKLVNGASSASRQLRSWFRRYSNSDNGDAAISSEEMEDFLIWMLPEWERYRPCDAP